MFTPKCPACAGTGMTMFRRSGGRCFTCGGSGTVTPMDVAREADREGRPVTLDDGRRVGTLLLADAGDDLVWVDAGWACRTGAAVLVPDAAGLGWEVARVADWAGRPSDAELAEAPF